MNFYIYISVYCTAINSFCLWLHTKKDLLKLYLLLNYDISDNHSIGQGKIKKTKTNKKTQKKQKQKQTKKTKNKKQKKTDKSVCWSLRSKQIRGLSSLLSRASQCRAKEAPGSTGFCTVSPELAREAPGCHCGTAHFSGWVQECSLALAKPGMALPGPLRSLGGAAGVHGGGLVPPRLPATRSE